MSFVKIQVLKVQQPLATFYVGVIKAKHLLEISFSEELTYINESGQLKGKQRIVDIKRLVEIGRYIDSVEMSFPNSIILAANYNWQGEPVLDEKIRWSLEQNVKGDNLFVNIPTDTKLASIIDGQHRLKAFEHVQKGTTKEIDLIVSIFFDLPNPYQAFLFATINGNQKRVDKGLALEQFGFNVEDEPRNSWTPEKLAVFLSRKLNFNVKSPLYNRIKPAPQFDTGVFKTHDFLISTATMVGGILSLISSQPKRDRVEMGQKKIFGGRKRMDLKDFNDSTPLRSWFFENRDDDIYKVVTSFFKAVNQELWVNASPRSYILKTVGIQALFDLLKELKSKNQDVNQDYLKWIEPLSKIDFTDNFFQASGTGRYRIKRVIFYANKIIELLEIKDAERDDVKRITKEARAETQ